MDPAKGEHQFLKSQYSTLILESEAAIPEVQTVKASTRAILMFHHQQPNEENGSEVYAAIIEQRIRSENADSTAMDPSQKEHPIEVYQEDSYNLNSLTSKSTLGFCIY